MQYTSLKFNLYSRGAKCVLCCKHKPLEPFLPKGIKIPTFNRLSMELTDYNITFVNIKDKHNISADAITRLKMMNIHEEPLENPKAQTVTHNQLLWKYVPLACTP